MLTLLKLLATQRAMYHFLRSIYDNDPHHHSARDESVLNEMSRNTLTAVLLLPFFFILPSFPSWNTYDLARSVGAKSPFEQDSETVVQFVSGQSAIDIPFELHGNLILINVRVNASEPLKFILDTGSEVSIIAAKRAQSLGLMRPENTRNVASPASLEEVLLPGITFKFSGLEVSNPTTVALVLDSFEPRLGKHIDGLIGANCLRGLVLKINYVARLLTLSDAKAIRYTGREEIIPISIDRNSPVVSATTFQSGSPPAQGRFLIDTGFSSSVSFDKSFIEAHRFLLPRMTVESSGSGVSGNSPELVARSSIEGRSLRSC